MALMDDPQVGYGGIDPTATALAFFVDKGYSPAQASGIVGNLLAESNLNTGAVGDGGISKGVAQWNGGRLANLRSFASRAGADPNDLMTQLEFVHHELKGSEGAANQRLLSAGTPEGSALAFLGFERPKGWTAANPAGGHNSSGRIANAQASLPLAQELAQNRGDGALITAQGPQAGAQTAGSIGVRDPETTGSIGTKAGGFSGGMMGKPYEPGSDGPGIGSTLSAIGMALLSGSRFNPLGNLPTILQAQAKDRQTAENQRYQRWNDQRNFEVARGDRAQQQANTDRSFGLQSQQLDLSRLNTEADNKRADAALDLQRQQAGAPKIMQDSTGGIVSVTPDGKTVTTLAPGQRVMTEAGKVEERKRIAEAYGLQPGTPEWNNYTLFNKPPEEMKAPTTKNIKQADGSEVSVQWDPGKSTWVPLVAPEGGNAVRGPGKLTEGQSKDLGFYNRGSAANENLEKYGGALKSGSNQVLNNVPVVGNYATSEQFKLADQAGREFLAAILRKDSGGAITEPENVGYGKIFLPRPGDTQPVLDQKRQSRQIAMESIKSGLGPAQVLARATEAAPPTIKTAEEYAALPAGATYVAPDGKRYTKREQ